MFSCLWHLRVISFGQDDPMSLFDPLDNRQCDKKGRINCNLRTHECFYQPYSITKVGVVPASFLNWILRLVFLKLNEGTRFCQAILILFVGLEEERGELLCELPLLFFQSSKNSCVGVCVREKSALVVYSECASVCVFAFVTGCVCVPLSHRTHSRQSHICWSVMNVVR